MFLWSNSSNVGTHKQISFRSFENYSVDEHKKALGQGIFPNYKKYSNVSKAYNNFFHKLIGVVNGIAPLKTVRIKNTSSEWFDREIVEKLSLRGKLFKKFKSSCLKKWCPTANKIWEEKVFWGKTGRKYSTTKMTLAGIKITRITKQKNFLIIYMLRK